MKFLKGIWDILNQRISVCDASLQTMMDIVHRGNLLNQRQCEDLTRKLTLINENVHLLVKWLRWYPFLLREYYQCFEKAKMLVSNCGEKEWWCAAALQWQNVNAFQEILLDASLCYNAIYELAKKMKEPRLPDDLRQSSVFEPASNKAVREDEEYLISRLGQLIKNPGAFESEHLSYLEEGARARTLARFLKNHFVNIKEKDTSIGMMWDDHMEHPGTWGEVCDLKGTGSKFVKALSTQWLNIPCFRKEFLADEDENIHEELFLKEASIMAHMKHPNVIRFLCHGNGQNPKCCFIGMELMEMNLSKLIEEQGGKPFPLDVAIDIIKQIARGMCYLHDQNVAHRDLKPQNVVVKKWRSLDLEGYCDVKLVDFGISKTEVDDTKSNTMTAFGIGTPRYLAPELHPSSKYYSKNKANWFKADAYSFAMTCLHVMSLQPPFPAEGKILSYEHYSMIMNGTLRPHLPIHCPQKLKKLLEDCWHILPRERPTFVQICSRLAHTKLPGETNDGIDFIHKKIVSQSDRFKRLPKVILDKATDKDVRIITCTSNHKLIRLQKPSREYKSPVCDICYPSEIAGEVYHCPTCHFDAHPDCAEIREKVDVFYHGHPLQLLVQNFYKNDPKAMCSLCEGSIQNSEWVYRCEQCEYDVHSLCTKFPINTRCPHHEHPLTMRSCPLGKSLFCERCSDEIQERTWHYHCRPCAFSIHIYCAFRPIRPLCIFDDAHRLALTIVPRIFDCALCDTQGYSQFYSCMRCNVDMHAYCVDNMDDETFKWNEAYEKVMMEKENKDVQVQIMLISEILDKMPSHSDSEAKSSTHKPPSVVRKVHTPIYDPRTPNKSHGSSDFANRVKLQRNMICAQTAKRIKAKRLSLKKVQEDPLEMLVNLEKIVSNYLQSIENAFDDEKEDLIAVHTKLKERQRLVKIEKATQEESKMCLGP